ncbi:hypothetical protein K1T71_001525 [Dendrolimus kikuchii]|uniref:Uncharacterized protein n=1 Tax=Dendrolimus kikuchii TaxID=765133 RepID=A0ACC1DIH2_9NEOP|nr:hypothetical protein K1T71_001525 [Dendrolimus kikuchii]
MFLSWSVCAPPVGVVGGKDDVCTFSAPPVGVVGGKDDVRFKVLERVVMMVFWVVDGCRCVEVLCAGVVKGGKWRGGEGGFGKRVKLGGCCVCCRCVEVVDGEGVLRCGEGAAAVVGACAGVVLVGVGCCGGCRCVEGGKGGLRCGVDVVDEVVPPVILMMAGVIELWCWSLRCGPDMFR